MSRNPQISRLISIIEPVLVASGYELVDLRFVTEQGGWTLRVCVDRPLDPAVDRGTVPEERVDLSACEEISRELSAVLDVDDPIQQPYNLEVSSPGIDRPLRTAAHFAYFAGCDAKITLAVPMQTDTGERRNFRGELKGVEGTEVLVDVDGQPFRLPIDDIEQAKLVPDWDEVMKGRSGVAGSKKKANKG